MQNKGFCWIKWGKHSHMGQYFLHPSVRLLTPRYECSLWKEYRWNKSCLQSGSKPIPHINTLEQLVLFIDTGYLVKSFERVLTKTGAFLDIDTRTFFYQLNEFSSSFFFPLNLKHLLELMPSSQIRTPKLPPKSAAVYCFFFPCYLQLRIN